MKWLCDLLNCECEPQVEECRGKPREQFNRHFSLIHPSVKEDVAIRIFREALAKGRTVGFSADDAGMGDLDGRFVYAYGWPDFAALKVWFAEHYPGVTVYDMPLPLIQFALVADVSGAGQGIVSRESFLKMKDQGVKGVYIRGPRGRDKVDTALQQNYLNAFDAGLLVGMYGVWFPNEDPAEQAQNFSTVYKSFIWDFAPAADFELDGDPDPRISIQQYLGFISQTIMREPLVYTRRTWWNPNVGDTNWAKQYPLWAAGYPNPQGTWHTPENFNDFYIPMGWQTWRMWQFGILPAEWFDIPNAQGLDMNWMKL